LVLNKAQCQWHTPAGCRRSAFQGDARCGLGSACGTSRNAPCLRSALIPPPRLFRTGWSFSSIPKEVFQIGVSCRDAARPPPWSRWSSSSRSRAWKRPLGRALSAYEGARLRQPAHERRASVTAGFAYERVSRVNRSRPFPCYGRGRERSASRGAGACPATAHWRAAGPPTKVRSSLRASNSVPSRLILTICLPLLLSLCASGSLAGASRCARGPPPAPSWLAGAVGPQALPPAPRPDLLIDPVAAEASSRRALRSVAGRCIVVTVVGLPVQCVTGPGRPRLGVQRPGPGPAVAHGYPGARRCASSAVRFAWCLARSPIWGF
jgi:hypothetical protein